MSVVTTLSEKRRKKQWNFERSVLRELSLKELKTDVQNHFKLVVPYHFLSHPFLLDPCMDMAVDAYLVGAEYGKFGYHGESEEVVMRRCEDDVTEITHAVFHLIQGWLIHSDYLMDSLHVASEVFVMKWWSKGFQEGVKRYRLRLH